MKLVQSFLIGVILGEVSAVHQTFNESILERDKRDILGLISSIIPSKYNVENLIKSNDYTVETHTVTTNDGYILTLHRIPGGRTGKNVNKVALLMHAFFLSSADWCVMGAGKSLAFLLADQGYDVWMGNNRGNDYSRKHVNLSASDPKYWRFSWHEIGIYDLPTFIDYILEKTGADGLYYAGHAQGTTISYVVTSSLPQYNDKLKVSVSLGPVGFVDHLLNPVLRVLSVAPRIFEKLFDALGINLLFPNTDFIKYVVGDVFCGTNSPTQELCIDLLSVLFGFNTKEMNTTLLPILFKYNPAGVGIRQLLHYAQEIQSGYFRQYDHGSEANLEIYGTPEPPNYNLSQIRTPNYLIYGNKNDFFSAEADCAPSWETLAKISLYLILITITLIIFGVFTRLNWLMKGLLACLLNINKLILLWCKKCFYLNLINLN